MPNTNGYYPICLALEDRPCLVVGGGMVAQQKIKIVLRYGGQLTVVSPTLTPTLQRWATQKQLTHRRRRFRPSDVRGQWLVYGATDDAATQQAVYRAATRARIWVNVVDVPRLCNFIMPAQVKRGSLTVAITTGGKSPGLSKRVRKEVERLIGPEYAAMLRLLETCRVTVRQHFPTPITRKRVLDKIIYSDVLHLLQQGKRRAANQKAQTILREAMNGR